MPSMIIYQASRALLRELREKCGIWGLELLEVDRDREGLTLEEILGNRQSGALLPPFPHGPESMVVFCGVKDMLLDRILADMRTWPVQPEMKAVLTDTNRRWNCSVLHGQLAMEKRSMEGRG